MKTLIFALLLFSSTAFALDQNFQEMLDYTQLRFGKFQYVHGHRDLAIKRAEIFCYPNDVKVRDEGLEEIHGQAVHYLNFFCKQSDETKGT